MVAKNSIANICSSFDLSIHQRILEKCIMVFKIKIKLHNCFQHWK